MIIEDTLRVLLRDILAESAIDSWLNKGKQIDPICVDYNKELCYTALMNRANHYSGDEAKYAYRYAQNYKLNSFGEHKNHGVFGLIVYAVNDMLTTDIQNDCLCRYKSLLDFRRLTHPIDPTIFVAAFLAYSDILNSFQRKVFSWNPIVRCDNDQLQVVLNHGMSENHFHIGGSTDAFLFQWICLMNHISGDRRSEFQKMNLEFKSLGSPPSEHMHISMIIKAAYIRYFLYCKLNGISAFDSLDDECMRRYMEMSAEACEQCTEELDDRTYALRSLCISSEAPEEFVVDYALLGEPQPPLDDGDLPYIRSRAVRNYERRLYRPLAGEQRFQYHLFKAIYQKDPDIIPYLDLAYAYLLIYCRFRAELVQVNERVGFNNFLEYQDRKEYFTSNWKKYEDLRCRVAQQVVTSNPQVISFEGRMCPADTPEKLCNKVLYMLMQSAINEHSSYYVRDFMKTSNGSFSEAINALNREKQMLLMNGLQLPSDFELSLKTLQNAKNKLSYVLHFPKRPQYISENESFELNNPRDSKVRKLTQKQSTAIIEARCKYPQIMSWVTAIDACSSEIDCRPEVFAPEFRHMKQAVVSQDQLYIDVQPVPPLKITYHAGEDFLDLIDGLRSIDEAISFLDMKNGDRIGHALALGVDCEEWYAFKGNMVVLQQQALLDNLVWLYGSMRKYNLQDTGVEDHVQKWYKKLFKKIYIDNIDRKFYPNSILFTVDLEDYYASLSLRGNDPYIYRHNPDGSDDERNAFQRELKEASDEPWRVWRSTGENFDTASNLLYHCYHWNYKMKLESAKIVEYSVPQCVVRVVAAIQDKMRYDIARCGIGIECNPSSNYLIGTFRDYLKHPIFKFDNRYLYLPSDPNGQIPNPHIKASINTDDLGIFDTSLENEYALMASALEIGNDYCRSGGMILPQQIYEWLDHIRENGCEQNFKRT